MNLNTVSLVFFFISLFPALFFRKIIWQAQPISKDNASNHCDRNTLYKV